MEGKAGVGKTSVILDAFRKADLKFAYFSAATMDPFVDFCGIPVKVDTEDGSYIELILPKHIKPNEVEAMFFDEYNRCLTGDTPIQLVDGYSVPIKDLVGKKSFYVYSYDLKNKKLAVGRGHSARKTGEKKKILKIILDNGLEVCCTPSHPFLLTSGAYINAEELQPGDALMSLYKKYNPDSYELVSSFRPVGWAYTYHLADEYNLRHGKYQIDAGGYRHHIDKSKFNNSPDNIQRVSLGEHFLIHSTDGGKAAHKKHPDLWSRTLGTEESKKLALSRSINTRKNSKSYFDKRSMLSKQMYDDEMRAHRSNITKEQWKNGQFKNIDRVESNRKARIHYTFKKLSKYVKKGEILTEEKYETIRRRVNVESLDMRGSGIFKLKTIKKIFGSFDNFVNGFYSFLNDNQRNHRIISIEPAGYQDVYDISVDEFNNFAIGQGPFVHNSNKKIRNATLELIQFKSINGRPFPKLRIIWAAINPEPKEDDEESLYNVERLDPAQKDRFHIHVYIPYECNKEYFQEKYDVKIATVAIEWWDQLPDKAKDAVSPRRLDYALDIISNGGDIADVLPHISSPSKLKKLLSIGPSEAKLLKFMQDNDTETAKNFLANPNNYDYSIKTILSYMNYKKFFLPLLPSEKIASLLVDKFDTVKRVIFGDLKVNKKGSVFYETLKEIADANQNHRISKTIRKEFEKYNIVGSLPALNACYNVNAPAKCEDVIANIAGKIGTSYQTHDRMNAYRDLILNTPKNMSVPSVFNGFKILQILVSRSQKSTLDGCEEIVPLMNHYVSVAIKNGIQPSTIEKKMGKELCKFLQQQNAPSPYEIREFLDNQMTKDEEDSVFKDVIDSTLAGGTVDEYADAMIKSRVGDDKPFSPSAEKTLDKMFPSDENPPF